MELQETRPVIILGGGLWGSLLAYRLKQIRPDIPFILYEKSSVLGGHQTWFFSELDIPKNVMKWVKPLIGQSWDGWDMYFPSVTRSFLGPSHFITSERLNELITSHLKASELKLNNELSPEIAIREGSFVIDTRNICHFKKTGYRKFISFEVELENHHGILRPVMMDTLVEQKNGCRFLRLFPKSESRIHIEDSRYSTDAQLNLEDLKRDICREIENRGWKIKQVLSESSGCVPIPMSPPIFQEENRIVNLAGLIHDTNGSSFMDAIHLIDRMLDTSFRCGELKHLIKNFRKEREKDRKFFRLINRFMFGIHPHDQYKVFQHFYHFSDPFISRFHRGKFEYWDRLRLLLGKPSRGMIKVLQTISPELYSGKVMSQ